jgi:hypothetical protein
MKLVALRCQETGDYDGSASLVSLEYTEMQYLMICELCVWLLLVLSVCEV